MDKEHTALLKSKRFAVRIVNLYKFLCNDRKSMFFPNSCFAAAQA